MPRPIHLVEPTGYSGIFQHTVALAEALGSTGERVIVHTAREHERIPSTGFAYCPCGTWPQRSPAGARQRLRLGARYLETMLTHLALCVGDEDIVHLQGSLAGVMSLGVEPESLGQLNAELDHVHARPRSRPHLPEATALVRAHAPAYLLDAEPDWAGRAVRAQVA